MTGAARKLHGIHERAVSDAFTTIGDGGNIFYCDKMSMIANGGKFSIIIN